MSSSLSKKEDINLDIRGQICPACLLITLREICNKKPQLREKRARLVVRTDHRDATRTIPDAAIAMGYEVNVTKVDNYYEITLEFNDE